VIWKAAAVLILVTVAGATAHAPQQQSAIETLGKTMSDLAKEGYEIKAAEDLSGICQNSFFKKRKASLSAK
jgi:hypothetical protein